MDNDDATILCTEKSKICQSIPSISILQENSINILDSDEDNDSIISENNTEFTDNHNGKKNHFDEIISEYEKCKEYEEYENTNINYNPVDIYHNPSIFNVNKTTKQVIF